MIRPLSTISSKTTKTVHSKPSKQPILLSRLLAYLFIYVFSIGEIVISSVVLAYSVEVYRGGYIKSNPQLVGVSAATFVVITFLILCGRVRRQISLWMELVALCLFNGLWFFSLIRMHVATPGLILHCGGFPICKGWITILFLAWFAWGSTCWAIVTLLIGAVYARKRPNSFIKESVWRSYPGHYFDPTYGHRSRLSMMTVNTQEADLFSREIKFSHGNHERQHSIDGRSQFTID